MRKNKFPGAVAACLFAAWSACMPFGAFAAEHAVWVEGEDFEEASVELTNPWYREVKWGLFSNGEALTHHGLAPGTALYRVEIPADGEYILWARVNPIDSRVFAQINEQEWSPFPGSGRDMTNAAADDQPDLRYLHWVRLEQPLQLSRGSHALRFRLEKGDGDSAQHGYLDCFLLTAGRFAPSGAAKPFGMGRDELPADPGTWAFDPGMDPYTDEALFDMRPLLDGFAGEAGWIRHDENGDFIRGDGSPIVFWAVNSDVSNGHVEDVEEHARHIAKRGVNLVRLFKQVGPASQDNFAEPNHRHIDAIQKGVAILKRQGIYSVVTPYWAFNLIHAGGAYRPFGRDSGDLAGLLFWEPELQGYFKAWLRELFTRPNPYDPGRTPLRDDPALAVFQIQNEDSFLFWTQWGVMNGRREEFAALNAMFHEWLAANGIELEIEGEFEDWLRENGYPADTRLDFRFWLAADSTRTPPMSFRLSMRFSAELMRSFNEEIARFIREDIGCPVLVNAGNWQTADQARLLDLERWSGDGQEVLANNRYVDLSNHQNPNGRGGYLVERGDFYHNASALQGDNWRMLATNVKQVAGKPMIITESCWVPPNAWQSEGSLLVAAYSALTGVDANFWVHAGRPGYDPMLSKWQVSTPAGMGAWPAAAWMLHRGYVRRGDPAVVEKRGLAGDLWDLNLPVIAEDPGFDPNRPGTVRARTEYAGGVPFGAFLIGPVTVEYGPDAAGTAVDLHGQDPADLDRGVIRSSTGELFLNAPAGLFTLDAPCAQAVAGFLREAGRQSTSSVDFDFDNEYAAVIVVSLDDRPLEDSGRILLQINTAARPHGWREEPAAFGGGGGQPPFRGYRILDTGSFPWNVAETRGTVEIRNAGLSKATLMDANFYAKREAPVRREGGALRLELPPDAMYVIIE